MADHAPVLTSDRAAPPLPPPSGRRGLRLVVVGLVCLLCGVDWLRPPARQWTARGEIWAIERYRQLVSPTLQRLGTQCRFTPSCSHYAEGAIRKNGGLVGPLRGLWRILRCGPWTAAGTIDPP